MSSAGIRFRPAVEADFEYMLDLSIRALRADLERVGRFDPERRRARMRHNFADGLLLIEHDGAVVGCLGVKPHGELLELHSVYIEPAEQGQGLGAAAFAALRAAHPGRGWWIEVLKQSPARGFWERQGFVVTGEQPHDWVMERLAD